MFALPITLTVLNTSVQILMSADPNYTYLSDIKLLFFFFFLTTLFLLPIAQKFRGLFGTRSLGGRVGNTLENWPLPK